MQNLFRVTMAALAFACCCGVLPASADKLAGASCAKSLAPDAMKVYQIAAPDIKADTDIRALLKAKLTPVVRSGEMTQDAARAAGQAAGPCLKALQQ
jgi:hypothetical protein